MRITMTAPVACPACGHMHTAFQFCQVRVNKNSLRTTSVTLGFLSRICQGCKAEMPLPEPAPQVWQVDPADAEKIEAYRAKRWPVAA